MQEKKKKWELMITAILKKVLITFFSCTCVYFYGLGTLLKNPMATHFKRACWKHLKLVPKAPRSSARVQDKEDVLPLYLTVWEGFLPGAFCSVEV